MRLGMYWIEQKMFERLEHSGYAKELLPERLTKLWTKYTEMDSLERVIFCFEIDA